ncbi:hypothetical protein [Pseudalkalibacillus caeni]|uniref:DUF2178 domain-containing protein n=1 Tax=Exobacillus caeni TaxID=2574798 RepID=A0A5R9FEA8_9BACL|nr:hypothetical protein [Pseudalkalibacillus caeni]TLS37955.1 hypothetical protein FCL54_09060 [Pseudalkalibacillus caeni]
MNLGLDNVLGMVGLFGGLLLGALGYFLGRHFAAQKRGLDERYMEIEKRSRNTSWWWTLAGIYIVFFLVLVEGITSPAPAIGIVLLIHMASYSFSVFYYNVKY